MGEDNRAAKREDRRSRFDILSTTRVYFKVVSWCVVIWGFGYYKFSPSWVALGAIGYVAYLRAYEKRSLIGTTMKAITDDEKASIIKDIGLHELPSWVYFPDVERAEWLNKIIQRMWPYITEYTNKVLVETVQPAINANLPTSMQPFMFVRTDLGDSPPRIGGVKVYTEESIRRDEIVLDVDLMFYSDARIKVSVGKIIAGVESFEQKLRGTMRVTVKPLVPKIPFVGAVTVCFLDNPYINFLLTHMGNILNMPGLHQTLYRTVSDAVSSLCVLPNRVSVPLVDDITLGHIKFPSAQGAVRIEVISASDLKASDVKISGKSSSDPYCIVRVGAMKFITKVITNTLNPSWNECFETIVDQRMGQSVIFEVWDKDNSSKDDELGLTSIPIEDVYLRGHINSVRVLEGVKRGKVHVRLTWLDLSPNPADFIDAQSLTNDTTTDKAHFSSYLFVRVEQAKNLMRLKFLQEPSPYCVLQIGNTVQNTPVREKTQNPVWDSTHHFLFSNPEIQALNIEIRDSKVDSLLGNLSIPLKHVRAEKDMCVAQPYFLQTAGPDKAFIYLYLELRALVPGPDREAKMKESEEVEAADASTDELGSTPPPSGGMGPGPAPQSGSLDAELPPTPLSPEEECVFLHKNHHHHKGQVGEGGNEGGGPKVVDPPNPAGRINLALKYNVGMEILEVTVDRAEDLLAMDKDGFSDPYVKLSVVDGHDHMIGDSKKTKVVKNDLNPHFEQSFEFAVKAEELEDCKLCVDVKNHVNILQRNSATHIIGSVVLGLRPLKSGTGFTEWYWLHRCSGENY